MAWRAEQPKMLGGSAVHLRADDRLGVRDSRLGVGTLALPPRRCVALGFVFVAAMPVRLWFTLGPFNTLTILDIVLWLFAGGWLVVSRTKRLSVGPPSLFLALCTPVVVAMLSLGWTHDTIATGKAIFYSSTVLLAYLVPLNLHRQCTSQLIARMMVLFLLVTVMVPFLYWLGVPFGWSDLGVLPAGAGDLRSSTDAVRSARLDSPFLGRSNDLAATLALYMLFFTGLSLAIRRARYARLAFVGALGLVLTLSRGVILAAGTVMAMALLKQRRFKNLLKAATAAGVLVLAGYFFMVAANHSGIDLLADRLLDPSNISNRMERLTTAVHMIGNAPLLGYGGGRFIRKNVATLDSAFHNTYLEQWAAYGLLFGSIVVIALLTLPWPFFRSAGKQDAIGTVARFIGYAIVLFLLICTNQTANEAAIPSLMFRLFLGYAVAYVGALRREQRQAQEGATPHDGATGYRPCQLE